MTLLPRPRDALRIALLVVLLLGAAEGLARLLVDPPPSAPPDGFDPGARYLVPLADPPGAYETRFQHHRHDERVVPPRGAARRLVLLGASSANGLTLGDLQGQLAALRGSDRVEVVNLGRPGYCSDRVLLIARQVLQHLEPDLLVLYTGDTELAEARGDDRGEALRVAAAVAPLEHVEPGAGDLRGTAGPSDGRGADGAAPLATTDAAAGHADAASLLDGDARPTAIAWDGDRTSGLARRSRLLHALGVLPAPLPEAWIPRATSLDIQAGPAVRETVLTRLERNLRAICRLAAAQDVPVVLCTVVYNRLTPPLGALVPKDVDPARGQAFATLRNRALLQVPESLAFLLPLGERRFDLTPRDWADDPESASVPPGYTTLPGRRAGLGRLAGADPEWTRPEGWSPDLWALYDALEQLYRGRWTTADVQALRAARRLLIEALQQVPESPRALFELGLIELAFGRGDQARARLEAAASLDHAPHRASERMNDVLRRVAEEEGAALFDADRILAGWHPDGIVGWDWMVDQCHMHVGARRALMGEFAAWLDARDLP